MRTVINRPWLLCIYIESLYIQSISRVWGWCMCVCVCVISFQQDEKSIIFHTPTKMKSFLQHDSLSLQWHGGSKRIPGLIPRLEPVTAQVRVCTFFPCSYKSPSQRTPNTCRTGCSPAHVHGQSLGEHSDLAPGCF